MKKQDLVIGISIINAAAAIKFYEEILGMKVISIVKGDIVPKEEPYYETMKDKIIHSEIMFKETILYITDKMSDTLQNDYVQAEQDKGPVSITILPESEAEIDQLFANLAKEGTVTMPLANQFWGDKFGSVIDKYGIHWALNLVKS